MSTSLFPSLGLTQSASQGIKYDKTSISHAMQNPFSIDNEINENGYFLKIVDQPYFNENGDFDKAVSHLLRDDDFDGVFDGYQLSILDESSTKRYNDNDFDGVFDLVSEEYYDSHGNVVLYAYDDDADGAIDRYGN